MLTVRKVDIPTSPTSLASLLDIQRTRPCNIGLQASENNLQIVYFGDAREQTGELRPQANAAVPEVKTSEVYVYGTSGDTITIFLF